jgi:hypothetical protein
LRDRFVNYRSSKSRDLTVAQSAFTLSDMFSTLARSAGWAFVLLATAGCGPESPLPGDPDCATAVDCEALVSVCAEVACIQGLCVVEPAEAGRACDDGLFCTQGEACDGSGACTGGSTPCNEIAPGLPICSEAERACQVCSDGRPLVGGECRCPYWHCVSRGGAAYCAEEDRTEENNTACYYDGIEIFD